MTNFRVEKIPFAFENNSIIVQVKINGKPVNLILDTGAKNIVITNPQILRGQDVSQFTSIQIKGLGKREFVQGYLSGNNIVEIKGITKKRQKVIWVKEKVIDFSDYYFTPIDGVLGSEFLKDMILEINYKRKFIKLHNPAFYRENHPNKIPLRFIDGKPVVEKEVFGKKALLSIDTGSNDALWWYGRVPENYPYKLIYGYLGLGATGEIYGYSTLIEKFHWKKYTFKEMPISIPDSLSLRHLIRNTNGIIGNALLKKFKIIINYPESYMILKKYFWESKHIPYDKSGLIVKLSEPRLVEIEQIRYVVLEKNKGTVEPDWQWETQTQHKLVKGRLIVVEDVVPGSPADMAGIIKGDIIEVVNGKPVYAMKSLTEFTAFLSGRKGKTVVLDIKRNNIRMRIKFKLRNYYKKE